MYDKQYNPYEGVRHMNVKEFSGPFYGTPRFVNVSRFFPPPPNRELGFFPVVIIPLSPHTHLSIIRRNENGAVKGSSTADASSPNPTGKKGGRSGKSSYKNDLRQYRKQKKRPGKLALVQTLLTYTWCVRVLRYPNFFFSGNGSR